MNGLLCRCTAVAVAAVVLLGQVGTASRATAGGSMRTRSGGRPVVGAASAHTPPQRIAVPEPSPRGRMPLPPLASLHAVVSKDVHLAHGVKIAGPPMLRPGEIDGVLTAARQRATQARLHPHAVAPIMRPVAAGGIRAGTAPGGPRGRGTRTMQSTAGTGINPWWRYQEENVPGGGRLMINVGTGNMLLQDDDMSLPHKGLAMAFRRTYNSQSQHDVNGSDGSAPSMFGNGWTSTFDAHLSSSATDVTTVWDIDGAHYDYTRAADGVSWISLTPGQYATLVWDHGCGYLWTKKSGTSYYFWQAPNGPCGPSYGGLYAGKLYQIIGRNRNTYITFNYGWDLGTHTSGDKVSAIYATTESGMTATLVFGDVSGRRLLDHITFPDGSTTVFYGYDAGGNLTWVSRPPNNAAGTRPLESIGYAASGGLMSWVASPRWNGPDGGALLYFSYSGTTAPTASVSGVSHFGVVNPSIPDGTGVALQPGAATGVVDYNDSWYGTGGSTPWFHDTDGHSTNWVMDAQRPAQTQECTATTGWNCTGTWLVSNETWDASTNNLISEVDPRGAETDYAYDLSGNIIAVGEPSTTTTQGTFKPTKLYDYDAFNNVVAYCDETETHQAGADWVSVPSASDSLCETNVGSRGVAHYTSVFGNKPAWEPFGELTSMTTPLGYTRRFAYDPSRESGSDFGLPTAVVGDPIVQADGSTIVATQSFWYDAMGNVRCYGNGPGTYVLSYDGLGRLTSEADPDDMSANGSSLCGKTAGRAGWNTQHTYTYFPSGLVATSQTPGERALSVATAYTYDVDSNLVTETHHHGCNVNSCTAGTTTKWYDGADRLVEVAEPHDPSDVYPFAWMTRYLYDLSQGNTVSIGGTGGATYRAYGNLYGTQKFAYGATDSIPADLSRPLQEANSPTWIDVSGDAYDALDRSLSRYSYLGGRLANTASKYDQNAATLGLLSMKTKADGTTETLAYESRGLLIGTQYSDNSTPAYTKQYDPNGRVASVYQSDVGTQQYTYDADGRLATSAEPNGAAIGLTSPATITYVYYGDGARAAVSVSSSALTRANLIQYSYRNDGLPQTVTFNNGTPYSFTKTYTDGGRFLTQSDPYAANAISDGYDSSGRTNLHSIPSGTFSAFQRDAENNILAFTAGGITSTQSYTVRGELVGQTVTSAVGPIPIEAGHMALGVLIDTAKAPTEQCGYATDEYGTQMQACGVWSIDIDVRAGTNLGTSWTFTDGFGKTCAYPPGDPCALQGASVNYDLNGRDLGSRQPLWNTIGQHYTYDFHDQIRTANTSAYTAAYNWGPNGHPIRTMGVFVDYNGNHGASTYRTLHWDGDDLLFETNSAGQVEQLRLPAIADIFPVTGSYNGLNVWDRDFVGEIAGSHNSTGNSPLVIRSASSPCQVAGAAGGSPGFVNTVVSASGCGSDHPGLFGQPRLDGFSDGQTTIQGVRAFSESTGTWTSPDAYAGVPDDPASQMPYMWNRNNPFAYFDPSGFCVLSAPIAAKTQNASGIILPIGCVTAKPVPPGKQLLPDGESVEQHIARNRATTTFLTEAMMFAIPGGQEADGALLAARLAGRLNLLGRTTYLYQKLSATGEHLKYGITISPAVRYWAAALNGGSLKILATGSRAEMLKLERGLHTYLPIGPEEGQTAYRAIQQALGYRLPPY